MKPDFDIHEALASEGKIAVIWCVEDVLELRPDLTPEQAWEVLEEAGRKHDTELGITWTTLEVYADDLFPEPDDKQEGQP